MTRIATGSGDGGTHVAISPAGRRLLLTIVHADGSGTAGVTNPGDGSVRDLGIRGHGFLYLPQGWLIFQQGTTCSPPHSIPALPRAS
jgi:hypothetical protein